MSRCVLVLGGVISDYGIIRSFLRDDDFFIYCDKALIHEKALGRRCSLAVGDFDSVPVPLDVPYVKFPSEKDDTDGLCGIKEGVKLGYREFLIIGALGGRIDHEIANIYMLDYLDSMGMKGTIITEKARIEIVSREEVVIEKGRKYFSLLSLFGKAEGIHISGAKYNLDGGIMESRRQYGISNEVDTTAGVRVDKGKLLLVVLDED